MIQQYSFQFTLYKLINKCRFWCGGMEVPMSTRLLLDKIIAVMGQRDPRTYMLYPNIDFTEATTTEDVHNDSFMGTDSKQMISMRDLKIAG